MVSYFQRFYKMKLKSRFMYQNEQFNFFCKMAERERNHLFVAFFGDNAKKIIPPFWFDTFSQLYQQLVQIPFFDLQITLSKAKQP